jgi:RHH-type rel operon transcriptional repressor/antitoxin RelB
MIALQLPLEVESRLEELSQKTGRTASELAVEAILEHLDDIEDGYIALERLKDLDEGRSHTIPLKDVMKRYGMDD